MTTRMIIIRDSAPLVGAEVRVDGHDDSFHTDDDGMVKLEQFAERPLTVRVRDGDDWVTRVINERDSKTLVVVDLSRRPTTDDFLHDSRLELGERYEFRRVLGRGGMGVVIEAHDTILRRPVAVKMLNDELQANEEARQILLTEGQALAQLSHEHLVSVYDVASAEGRVFMVMEYVDGKNLDDHVQEAGLDQHLAVRAAIQLVDALVYLHEQKFVHRDVKPANCMLQENGDLKLIDFGLARSLEHIIERGTRVRGSPAYMAPEQIQGEELTGKSDVYQVGVSLFEMVTGSLPFAKGSLAYAHVHETAPRADTLAEGILPSIADLIAECLEKAPGARPTARQVAERLREIDASRSTGTLPFVDSDGVDDTPSEDPSVRGSGRLPLLLLATALVIAAIGTAAFVSQKEPVEVEATAAISKPTAAAAPAVNPQVTDEPPAESATPTATNIVLARSEVSVGVRAAAASARVLADRVPAQSDTPTRQKRKRAAPSPPPAEPEAEVPTDAPAPEPTAAAETPDSAAVDEPDAGSDPAEVAAPERKKFQPKPFEPVAKPRADETAAKKTEETAVKKATKPKEKTEEKTEQKAEQKSEKKSEKAEPVPLGF